MEPGRSVLSYWHYFQHTNSKPVWNDNSFLSMLCIYVEGKKQRSLNFMFTMNETGFLEEGIEKAD